MMQGQNDIGCLIRFIPARRSHADADDAVKETVINQPKLSGHEARTFYEDLLKDESCYNHQTKSCTPENSKKTTRKFQKASTSKKTLDGSHGSDNKEDRKRQKVKGQSIKSIKQDQAISTAPGPLNQAHNKLLAFCQNGDLIGLKKLVENEARLDLDHTDQYGWTSLMCATVAKHKKVVDYLLSKGTNRHHRNSSGKSAFDLAQEVSATKILNIFIGVEETPVKINTERNSLFYCDTCKANFSESSEKQHSSSTVHLFNLKLKPKPDPFMIPESNIGYQLMRSSGWDGEAGLGPGGKGAKFPVKTILKTDRSCLGSEQSEKKKPKITHFGPNDPESVSNMHKHSVRVMSARASSRRERMRREKKDKQWERKLRQYWDMDCDSVTLDKM